MPPERNMNPFIENLCQRIPDCRGGDDWAWDCGLAGDLLSKRYSRGFRAHKEEVDSLKSVTPTEALHIENALLCCIAMRPPSQMLGMAIWALGKSNKAAYLPVYLAVIEANVGPPDFYILGQSVIAIDNFASLLTDYGGSYSTGEPDLTMRIVNDLISHRGAPYLNR
jgi:hypothetical protein